MTLDELAAAVASTSTDPVVQRLAALLLEWKENATTVEELRNQLERYIGNSRIDRDEDHKTIYALWSEFIDNEVAKIGGMTMNERLYFFCLEPRFDAASTPEQRLQVLTARSTRPPNSSAVGYARRFAPRRPVSASVSRSHQV